MKKLMLLLMSVVLLAGFGCSREADLEETAVSLVTEILEENIGKDNAAKCINVKITEKINDKHYRAVATLNNGNDLNIIIEDQGEMVQVTIPMQD